MKTLLLAALIALQAAGIGRIEFEDAVARLCGAASIEEIDQSEMERFESLRDHPLDINNAPAAKLRTLLNPFQVASLVDYRTRTGDVLSLDELSLVDGFSEEFCEALSYFVVVRSRRAPGSRERTRVSHEITARAALRSDFGRSEDGAVGVELASAYGAKYMMEIGEKVELNWASRVTYSDPELRLGAVSAAYYYRSGKVVVGDYSARFGQGLVSWSGFSMSGFSSVGTFRKSGAGLSATSSMSAFRRGVAADWSRGKWTVSAGANLPGVRDVSGREIRCFDPVFNATRVGRRSTVGLTARGDCVGADYRFSLPSVTLFGESAVGLRRDRASGGLAGGDSGGEDGSSGNAFGGGLSVAGLGGFYWVPNYGSAVTALARYYAPGFPSASSGAARSGSKAADEVGLALGAKRRWLEATADYALHPAKGKWQTKSVVNITPSFNLSKGDLVLEPKLRTTVRWSSSSDFPLRTDVRLDICLKYSEFYTTVRLEGVHNQSTSCLGFLEAAYKPQRFSAYLRATLFRADKWNDRIYVYEHDAPGNFTVPAYYGRGASLSLYASAKFRRQTFYLRLSGTAYPWTSPSKPARLESKIQYRLRF